MKRTLAGFIVGAVLSGTAVGLPIAWRSESPYRAIVRCEHMAEDSAGHLRLIDYGRNADGTLRLIYRCRTSGY